MKDESKSTSSLWGAIVGMIDPAASPVRSPKVATSVSVNVDSSANNELEIVLSGNDKEGEEVAEAVVAEETRDDVEAATEDGDVAVTKVLENKEEAQVVEEADKAEEPKEEAREEDAAASSPKQELPTPVNTAFEGTEGAVNAQVVKSPVKITVSTLEEDAVVVANQPATVMTPGSAMAKLATACGSAAADMVATSPVHGEGTKLLCAPKKHDDEVVEEDAAAVDVGEPKKLLNQELDFDVNPSELYLLLQRRDWDGATERLKECPHEATHWISRRELDGKLRWRLLPIHGAIIFSAPDTMVRQLVESYPDSVSMKDDQGMLPLHLSYRMGSPASVVEVLLEAFPESIEVKDRKGRTPVTMAQTSKGPNRDEFIQTIEKATSPTSGSIMAASVEGTTPTEPVTETVNEASAPVKTTAEVEELTKVHRVEVEELKTEAAKLQSNLEKDVAMLRDELKVSEESAAFLVEHVAALEKKTKQQDETETALAKRIATLDNSFKVTLREKQALEAVLETEREGFKKRNEGLEEKLTTIQKDYNHLREKVMSSKNSSDKGFKELEEKYSNKKKDYDALKVDYEGVCNNVAILEGQLRNKMLHEQKLVKQVSSLAKQLSLATDDNETATTSYTERLHSLQQEREDLRSTVKMLSKKLFAVSIFLGEMEDEQAAIYQRALAREREMSEAADRHKVLVEEIRANQQYFQEAKDQRALLAELMRQQEDALDKANADRDIVVSAVEEHATHVESNMRLRKELLSDAGSLKNQITSILGSVKLFIPKDDSTSISEETDVDNVVHRVLAQQTGKPSGSDLLSEVDTSGDDEDASTASSTRSYSPTIQKLKEDTDSKEKSLRDSITSLTQDLKAKLKDTEEETAEAVVVVEGQKEEEKATMEVDTTAEVEATETGSPTSQVKDLTPTASDLEKWKELMEG